MTQQIKQICVNLLRVCHKITSEVLPLLYAAPTWKASCRLEALASQIGITNFALIKKLGVDADDLSSVIGSLVLDLQENNSDQAGVSIRDSDFLSGKVSVDLRREMESRIVMENLFTSASDSDTIPSITPQKQRRLRFANLEVLEVDGYQSIALTSKGSKRSRREAMRLCHFAKQILSYHPVLNMLVQAGGDMGRSDALDLSMGRVKWRFLRGTGIGCPRVAVTEHKVDLVELSDMLEALVELDEQDSVVKIREKEALAGWTLDGFRQYPYLTSNHS